MPEFVNPFSGVVPGRKLTMQELIRGIRLNIAAEQEFYLIVDAAGGIPDKPYKMYVHSVRAFAPELSALPAVKPSKCP